MKKVFINIKSESLGDNIAWLPYVEEYRIENKCEVATNFRYPELFGDVYPSVGFFDGIPSGYNVIDVCVTDRTIPLQQTASNCLGLPYREIRPKFNLSKLKKIGTKIVTISEYGSNYSRMWNNPYGWRMVVDYLRTRSYTVMAVSHESTQLQNVIDYTGHGLIDVCNALYSSDMFVGVNTGLSWLAWSLSVPVVMIGSNTKPYFEFQEGNYRISADSTNPSICTGCYNNNQLDVPWEDVWCPYYKDTVRQHECTKTISPKTVIKGIDKVIENIALKYK